MSLLAICVLNFCTLASATSKSCEYVFSRLLATARVAQVNDFIQADSGRHAGRRGGGADEQRSVESCGNAPLPVVSDSFSGFATVCTLVI